MRDRLVARDIPLEALYDFDIESIFAVRAVGAGSAAARKDTFRELSDMAPGFDEIGRKNLQRDKVANELKSYRAADRYAPPVEKPRVPIDSKIAELENNQMEAGMDVQVLGNELHLSHLAIHTDKINGIIQGVEEGTMDMMEVTPLMVKLHGHATAHLEIVGADPVAAEDVAFYRQVLQQAGEIIMNGVRMLEKAQREGGGEEGAEGQASAEDQEFTAGLQRQLAEHQQKLANLQQEHDLKMQLQINEAETKRAIASADAASKLSPAAHLK